MVRSCSRSSASDKARGIRRCPPRAHQPEIENTPSESSGRTCKSARNPPPERGAPPMLIADISPKWLPFPLLLLLLLLPALSSSMRTTSAPWTRISCASQGMDSVAHSSFSRSTKYSGSSSSPPNPRRFTCFRGSMGRAQKLDDVSWPDRVVCSPELPSSLLVSEEPSTGNEPPQPVLMLLLPVFVQAGGLHFDDARLRKALRAVDLRRRTFIWK